MARQERGETTLYFSHGDNSIAKQRCNEGGTEEIMKHVMIDDYNPNMGVDRNDQMILYYGYSHR